MDSSNGNQAPSHEPDFKSAFHEAQSSGDFTYVMETAKESDKMLRNFKEVVSHSQFTGRDAKWVAMGLNFLDNMIVQSAQQLENLKRTEKVTRDAIKAAQKGNKMEVVGPGESVPAPEVPVDPPAETPEVKPDLAEPPPPDVVIDQPPVQPDVQAGWETPPQGA